MLQTLLFPLPPSPSLSSTSSCPLRPSRPTPHVALTPEEEATAAKVSSRVASCLTSDHIAALFPDVETPFESPEDAVNRLLPYHIFQIPKEDLGKGKQKATEEDFLKLELAETKFALECFKRRRALETRFRRARIKSGKRTAPDSQAYLIAQAVQEIERAETAAATAETRTAKADLDRIEREKRMAAMPPRPAYYSAPQTPVYAHHYRTYQYPYAQSTTPGTAQGYPYSMPVATTIQQYIPPISATPASTSAGPSTPTTTLPAQPPGAIPVQLPASHLPTLHALGIVPVHASTLPATASDQQPHPAIIRSTSADGSMLHIELNVSLLQAAQMSGLALVLNSLMRGTTVPAGPNGSAPSVQVPPMNPYAQIGAPYSYPYVQPQLQASAPNSASANPKIETNGSTSSAKPPKTPKSGG
ncbi:hypothetical protein FA95DRAFT_1661675 [Auriscalpium vulgare]|uniref:Uncharacterized protein n=1 Tax=Auriscalpium vulgare TaxID=40419 RepID=A0ACB8RUY1_9AGAM|nr:hypothetical protein FA95DRAFT_1661675 [Auriscalpium vulgare]